MILNKTKTKKKKIEKNSIVFCPENKKCRSNSSSLISQPLNTPPTVTTINHHPTGFRALQMDANNALNQMTSMFTTEVIARPKVILGLYASDEQIDKGQLLVLNSLQAVGHNLMITVDTFLRVNSWTDTLSFVRSVCSRPPPRPATKFDRRSDRRPDSIPRLIVYIYAIRWRARGGGVSAIQNDYRVAIIPMPTIWYRSLSIDPVVTFDNRQSITAATR